METEPNNTHMHLNKHAMMFPITIEHVDASLNLGDTLKGGNL